MSATKIEWCTHTLNPIVGCSKTSAGCQNCYAERMAVRLAAMGRPGYADVVDADAGAWNGKTAWVDGVLEAAIRATKPRRLFVGSMTDMFHPSTPFEWIDRIMAAVALTPWHEWIFLTKRPSQFAAYMDLETDNREEAIGEAMRVLSHGLSPGLPELPLPNLTGMVTVCNQDEADRLIPRLLSIPLARRGVSIEPMLGPVDLSPFLGQSEDWPGGTLDWVILGGETGPGARPMDPDWARKVRDDCVAAGTPFFFKSLGEWSLTKPMPACGHASHDGKTWWRVGKRHNGRLLDGREWNQLPGMTT